MIRRLFSGRLRESWVHCGILTLFLAVVILVVHLVYPDSVYGSQTDWSNQHFAIPEYFRTRFYATGELFPNFALHLGGGQNIYNFAYYGLYNPIQLLSYCFPHVTMAVYLQAVSILNTWLSTMLCYVDEKMASGKDVLFPVISVFDSSACYFSRASPCNVCQLFPISFLGTAGNSSGIVQRQKPLSHSRSCVHFAVQFFL